MIEFVFLALFFVVYGVHVVNEFFANKTVRQITKPLLIPLIILYYIFGVGFSSVYWLLILALIFGWCGDIFLMIEREEKWFMLGLGSFLIGHIFYIILYALRIGNILAFPLWGLILFVPLVISILFFTFRIKGKMGDMTVPTSIYIITIFLMSVFALLLLAGFELPAFLFVYFGAILFMVSDGIIAINKFDTPIQKNRVYVMLTYGLAQLFIAQGFLLSQL
jgi:uncharacterized membrane protein YhhN